MASTLNCRACNDNKGFRSQNGDNVVLFKAPLSVSIGGGAEAADGEVKL